jgi:lysophospholipase L1-like esterase
MLTLVAALLTAPSVISPYDPRICYIGRFDRRNAIGPIGAWPAVEARVRVKGAGLKVTIQEAGHDWIQIVLDGTPTRALELQAGVQTVEVLADSPGDHTYEFFKRTEGLVGTTQFLEFAPDRGSLLKAKPKPHLLLAIGDAITCGFGNEATGAADQFSPATENAYMSYASIAARKCGADVEMIASSGSKMWPDKTVASIFDLTNPLDPTSAYGFRQTPAPEAILINLGTNDFYQSNPDEAEWTGAYKDFIARVRSFYPKAEIYVAIGSMLSDTFPEGNRALSTIRSYLTRMVDGFRVGGDAHIRMLEFAEQSSDDGYGAAYHPSLATHEKMAEKLTETLQHDLRW